MSARVKCNDMGKTLCSCLEKTEKEAKKHLLDTLKKKGTKVHEFVDESESGFTCKGLFFSGGGWKFVLPLEFKYIIEKKDGTPEKRTTTFKTNFIPTFCPLCGKKTKS